MSIVPRQNLLPRNNAHLAMDDYRSIKDLLGIVIGHVDDGGSPSSYETLIWTSLGIALEPNGLTQLPLGTWLRLVVRPIQPPRMQVSVEEMTPKYNVVWRSKIMPPMSTRVFWNADFQRIVVICDVRGHECKECGEASLYNEFLGRNRVADGRLTGGARLPLPSDLTGPMREHGLLCELMFSKPGEPLKGWWNVMKFHGPASKRGATVPLEASFYSTQLGETRNSVAELRANTIWKSSELSPEMERTYRMVAYDHELVPPPQSDSEELDATGDRPPQRWQQQARPGRYLADLSTVDLTAVGYARAAMPGCGGGADEGIIVQITSPRPPPQQLLPRDPNTTGGGCNAEEEAHFPDYGQTEECRAALEAARRAEVERGSTSENGRMG